MWDDNKKAEAVEKYLAQDPTPETSIECVKSVAEEMNETVNGVRSILSLAKVYIKKTSTSGSSTSGGETKKRLGKAEQQKMLIDAINDTGQKADESIIDKLSGKAAAYLADVIKKAVNDEEEENDV